MKIPEINKTYNCFNDGKIRISRLYTVIVKDVIPFNKIDKETLEQWKEEVKECYWLYKTETDFFIKTWNGFDFETFVRTKDERWFSMGFMCAGLLDVDGKFSKYLESRQ